MAGLEALTGVEYGPFPVAVGRDAVDGFVEATHDDPAQATSTAPPMFANVALFAAAPAFLRDEVAAPYTKSLIHSDQTYEWHRPLNIGETLSVVGTVASVRARGPLNLVTFSTTAGSAQGQWLNSMSVFLMSDVAAAAAEDALEPAESDRPVVDDVADRLVLPPIGESIAARRCGASRDDLRRYAVASGDSNPIHLEHDAARAAGLPGVIVHGLLMGAWMASVAGQYGLLRSLRVRFRSPLRPAVPATVSGTVSRIEADAATIDLELSGPDDRLVTGRASVTPW